MGSHRTRERGAVRLDLQAAGAVTLSLHDVSGREVARGEGAGHEKSVLGRAGALAAS